MKTSRLPMDLRIALLYIVFGGIWIFASDYVMERGIHDVSTFSQFEVIKGLVFVSGSATLIYFLTRREHGRRGRMEEELRRSEKAAAQSTARFSTIFHASPAPIAISRLSDQEFIEVNEAFQTLTGYALPEIIHHTPAELKLWVDPQERSRLIELLTSKGKVDGFEFRLRQKSGAVLEMQLWAEIVELDGELCMLNIAHNLTDRKHTERLLQESEQRFRTALNSMMEGCQIVDFDWRYIYVNEAAARQGGCRPEQLLMHTMSEAYPGIEDTAFFQTLRNCMLLRVPGHVETELDIPNHFEGCFEFSIQPVPEGLFILSMDVSERKRAEAALRAAEEKYRTIFDGAVEGIFQSTPDGRFITVNPAFARMWGYESTQEMIDGIQDIATQVYADPELRKEYRRAMQEHGEVRGFEFEARRKDGTPLWVSENARLVTDAEGNGEYYEGNIQDITARKLAEASLQRSEERYRTLAEAAQEMIVIVDEERRLEYVNEYGTQVFGQPAAALIGKKFDELYPNLITNTVRTTLQNLIHSGEAAYYENLVSFGNGDVWMGTRLVPIHDDHGKARAILSVSRDITAQKRAAEELRSSEKRYRSLFENSPVSLWEEDFSAVKIHLDELRASGVTDFRAYFESNPKKVIDCLRSIRVLDVNKATLRLQEVDSKEQLLNGLESILRADVMEGFVNELIYIAEGSLQFAWEGVNYTQTGRRRDISLNWSAAPGHEKDLSRVIVSIVDVTERKQAEQALKSSEARYRGLFEDSPIGLREEDFSEVKERLDGLKNDGIEDLDSYLTLHPEVVAECAALAKVVDVNNTALRQYGATSKAQLPKALNEILEGDAIGHFTHQLAQLAEGQTHFSWEGRDRKVDGTPIYVQASWSVAPGHQHDLSKVIVSVLDITERKQAEEAMRESEEKYRKLFAEMFSGCALHEVICDEAGQPVDYITLDANDAYERFLEVTRDQVIGKRASEVLPPDELKQWLEVFGPVALEGKTTHYEMYSPLKQKQFEGNAFCPQKGKFAVTFSDITERKNSEEKIQQQLKRITALRDIDRIITSSLDLRLTLNRLIAHVTEQLQLDAAAILLFDPHTFTLQYYTSRGLAEREVSNFRTPLRNELAGRVAMEQKPLHVDLRTWTLPSGERHPFVKQNFVEYHGLPLISKGKLRGVLEVYHRSQLSPDSDWFNYLETLAGQAAIAIDNIQMFDGLQRSNIELARAYDATIEGWSRALDMRDKETEGHTQRVTELTTALAREFGFAAEELVNIRWGALLHDIGKMGIPDAILLKPGPLTEEEWARMKQHPELAYEMLSSIQYLRNALDIPHYHHEKWDGSGYPKGLRGEQIPLAARIFAIADVWDALRSDRPYRPAWPARKALNYIRKLSGTQLDPNVVEVFMKHKIYEMKTPIR